MTTALAPQKAHSKLGASSYERWKACPGSIKASEGLPNISSIYAMEGTLAHKLGEKMLRKQLIVESDWVLENGEPFDGDQEEMLEAVQVYAEHIENLRAMKPSFEVIEHKFHLSALHPELYGTADYVCYFSRVKTLHVVDYKHGKGIPVDVNDNEQLKYYALGALLQSKFAIEKVVITIVQPRCYHHQGGVRSWETDPVTMTEFSFTLVDDALATEKPDAPRAAGEHCRFCPAQPTCPKPREIALATAQTMFKDESGTVAVGSIAPEVLGTYLTRIPQIKAWCEAVNSYAHQQASLGVQIPGFKLVDKRANRRWAEGVDAFVLSQALEKDESKFFDPEPKMLSPAKVEKLLSKPQKDLLNKFVVKESSGKTLVPTADDRKGIEGAFKNET